MPPITQKVITEVSVKGSGDMKRELSKARKDVETETKGIAASFKKIAASSKVAFAAVAAAVGAAIGVLVAMTKQAAILGDSFEKMSLRTGLASELLSTLAYAAERSGTSINSLEIGLRRMAANVQQAAKGTGAAADAFAYLGVKVTDTNNNLKSQDTLLYELADALAKETNSTKKAAIAMDIFGRAGVEMLPMLSTGSEGIKKLQERMQDLGGEISTEMAAKAAVFMDAQLDMETAIRGLKTVIAAELMPTLSAWMLKLAEIISGTGKLVRVIRGVGGFTPAEHEWLAAAETEEEYKRRYIAAARGEMPALPPIPEERRKAWAPTAEEKRSYVPAARGEILTVPPITIKEALEQYEKEQAAAQAAEKYAKSRLVTERQIAQVGYEREQAQREAAEEREREAEQWKQDIADLEEGEKKAMAALDDGVQDLGDAFAEALVDAPKAMEMSFQESLARMQSTLMIFGMSNRGVFGGIGQITSGLGAIGAGREGPQWATDLSKMLSTAGAYGQVAAGLWQVSNALMRMTVPDYAAMSTAELEQIQEAQGAVTAGGQQVAGAAGTMQIRPGVWVRTDVGKELARREEGAGARTGSQAFTAVTTVTEVQANQMVGILETQRAQDAQRNDILTDIAVSNRNIESATGISAGMSLLRFQGV